MTNGLLDGSFPSNERLQETYNPCKLGLQTFDNPQSLGAKDTPCRAAFAIHCSYLNKLESHIAKLEEVLKPVMSQLIEKKEESEVQERMVTSPLVIEIEKYSDRVNDSCIRIEDIIKRLTI